MLNSDDGEQCQAWQPIPPEFSGVWQVDVVHLAEAYDEESRRRNCNLSLAIAAYSDRTDERPRRDRAWRLDFTGCQAYRKRVIDYPGAVKLTRPQSQNHGAFWEITSSHYLVESGVQGAYPSSSLHHYVIIAAIHDVYEILAAGWHCEPLPAEWAKPFDTSPTPRW